MFPAHVVSIEGTILLPYNNTGRPCFILVRPWLQVMTHLCTDLRRVSGWRPQVLLCGHNTIQIGLRLCNRHICGGYHGGCYRNMLFMYSFDVLLALFVTSERIQAVSAVVPWLPHASCILRVLTTCLLSPNCGLTLKASHLDAHYRR